KDALDVRANRRHVSRPIILSCGGRGLRHRRGGCESQNAGKEEQERSEEKLQHHRRSLQKSGVDTATLWRAERGDNQEYVSGRSADANGQAKPCLYIMPAILWWRANLS